MTLKLAVALPDLESLLVKVANTNFPIALNEDCSGLWCLERLLDSPHPLSVGVSPSLLASYEILPLSPDWKLLESPD